MPFTQTYIPLYVRIKKFNNKVDNKPNTELHTGRYINISHTHSRSFSIEGTFRAFRLTISLLSLSPLLSGVRTMALSHHGNSALM